MARHDIRQILSRPALSRLAKIERVAEEVASAVLTASTWAGPCSSRPRAAWAGR